MTYVSGLRKTRESILDISRNITVRVAAGMGADV